MSNKEEHGEDLQGLQPVLFLYFGCHKLIMNNILVFIPVIKFDFSQLINLYDISNCFS